MHKYSQNEGGINMFFLKNNATSSAIDIRTEAPEICEYYMTQDKVHAMNLVSGYAKGPQRSYAHDLIKRYPLKCE